MFRNRLPSLTIFLGSFLIFGIQPMLGRTLLPVFGGTAAVWTTCLATFQMLLLAGYWYGHVVSGRARSTVSDCAEMTGERGADGDRRPLFHIALLGLSVVWVGCFATLRPCLLSQAGRSSYPVLEVLFHVLAFAGLPYVLLSANATLIQAWVARRMARPSDVYALYAVSNAGSLLGLLCYPFLVEPFLSLNAQWYGFAACLALYAMLLSRLAKGLPARTAAALEVSDQRPESLDEKVAVQASAHSVGSALLWFLLPAISTFLLNAVTAHLSTDVTPIPLLWVVLLAAFLLSYIIGFSKIGERGVLVWCVLGIIPVIFCACAIGVRGERGFLYNFAAGALVMLFGCIFLHAWLYRCRPAAERLTRYYLCVAAGGALGGLLSGIVAPLLFTRIIEYRFALVTVALFSALYAWTNTVKKLRLVAVVVQIAVLTALYLIVVRTMNEYKGLTIISQSRNFYGCLTVSSVEVLDEIAFPVFVHRFQHGQTLHGLQYQSPDLCEEPTSYYGPLGGGLAILSHPSYTNGTPMSVGLIGLGIGTLACWGRTNDTYRFFEINPRVVDIAWDVGYFSYLSNSKAMVSIGQGDARKLIATETNRYDILVVDAYSGDAIPFHLATREAFKLYLDHLNPGGILAMHITNWHIDLSPLCKAVGREFGRELTGVISHENGLCFGTTWVFISERKLPIPKEEEVHETDWARVRDIPLPSDDCGSLINLVRYDVDPPIIQK